MRSIATLALLVACILAPTVSPPALAATIIKTNNTLNLNVATSWFTNGPPTAADVARWDNSVATAANNAATLGADLNWLGIEFVNPAATTWTISGANTLTLGSAGIDMSAATKNLTLNCVLNIATAQTWNVTTGRTLTSGASGGTIGGFADLTKAGAGILVLSGANTYTGRTVVTGGILSINADARLGAVPAAFTADALTLNGGTLRQTASFTLEASRGITLGASGGTFDGNAGTLTIPSIITGAALTKTGAQPLVLTGTNTYTDGTTISAGILRADDGTGIPAAGTVTLAGGIWETGQNISRTLGTASGNVQLTTTLTGFSAFGAPVTITLNGGTPITWGTNSFAPAASLTLNSTLADNTLTFANGVDLNSASARTVTVNANSATLAGTLANTLAGGLTKAGAGRLILAGTNTYAGTTTLSAGPLRAGDGIGLSAGNLTIAAGFFEPIGTLARPLGSSTGQVQLTTLNPAGFSAFGSNATVSLGGAIVWGAATFTPSPLVLNATDATHDLVFNADLDLNGAGRVIQVSTNTVTLNGTISHAVSSSRLQKTGVGTLILTGTNTWSHTQGFATNLFVTAGTLQISQESNLGGVSASFQSRAVLFDGGTLRTTASVTIDDANRGLYIGASDLRLSVDPATTLTIASPIDGASGSALIMDGPGTLILTSTNNNYGSGSGGHTAFIAGTIQIATDANLGTNTADITVSGDSALAVTASTTLNSGRLVNLNTPWTVAITNGATLTIAGAMNESVGAAGALTKSGAGTLILSGNNDWNSPTLIAEGILQFGANNALPDTAGGDVTIAAGATLDLAGFSGTTCAIAGPGTIDNTVANGTNTLSVGINAASTTFSGIIQNTAGILALTKVGAGTLTLSGPNTYSGNTTITTGMLKLGAADVIPNGAGKGDLTVTTLLDLAGFSETVNGLSGGGSVTNSTGSATLTFGDNDAATTFTGTFRDGGGTLAVTKIGAGLIIISGANTHSGDTTISNGTLRASGGAAIPDGPGRGNVSVAAAGTLDVITTETMNGLAGSGTVNNSIASARILTIGANDQTSHFSGIITNSGGPLSLAITKTGTGTLTLSGNNGNGGVTIISAGILRIGNGGTTGTLGTGNVTDNASLVIDRDGAYTYGGVISGTGTLTKTGPGTLTLSGVNSYTGQTTINGGNLQISANERIANASPLRIEGGTLDLQSFTEVVSNVTLVAGSIIGSGALTGAVYNVESGTIAATLGGPAALTKSTTGTVVLASANSYAGGTTINGGTLRVDNATASGTGSGAVTVNSGGTLAGTGAIAGAVTVNSGGALAPGASVGTLTMQSLILTVGALATFEFNGGPANDRAIVLANNGLTLNGGAITVVAEGTATPWTANGTYPLFQYTGTILGAGPSALTIANPQSGKEYVFTTSGGWVVLIISSLGAPQVTNAGGASGIAAHSARLNGFLVSTGGVPTSVTVYWGTTDGGTNAGAWANATPVGVRPVGDFHAPIPPPWLAATQSYFYRSFALNANGSDWADSSTNFTTTAESGTTESAIDLDLHSGTADFGPSPNTVFVDYHVGYVFFVDLGGEVAYRKTLDGGASWGPPVSLGDDQDDGVVAVWYDGWTPGNAGTSIHLAHVGSNGDDLTYNTFDTANDTASGWKLIVNSTVWSSASRNHAPPAITKSSDGRLFAAFGATVGIATNPVCWSWDGTSWFTNSPTELIAVDDFGQLLPLSGGDVILVQHDFSAGSFRSAVLSSNGTWSAWATNIASSVGDGVYLSPFGTALNPLNGDLHLVAHSAPATAAGDLRTSRFDAATRTWSTPVTIVDDAAVQISSATVMVDANTGDLYAVYARRSTGSITTSITSNMFLQVRHSADAGLTWSAETTISSLPDRDIRIVRGNLLNAERLFVAWVEKNSLDLYGNTVVDLSPTRLRITSRGFTNLTAHGATLHGELPAEGGSPANVWLYWGTTNVGQSNTGWEFSANLGTPGTGQLAAAVGNLLHMKRYYYTWYATNAQGDAWADTIPTFRTPLDHVIIGGTNYFGLNMDFEINYGFNDNNPAHGWYQGSGDEFYYAGAEQGITPIASNGVQMLRLSRADSDGENCDVQQIVDLSEYTAAITNGDAQVGFSASFNGVPGATAIDIAMVIRDAANSPLAAYVTQFTTDSDVNTWEAFWAGPGVVTLPPSAQRVDISYKAFGDGQAPQNDVMIGHYADQAELRVIFPLLDREPPTGLILLVR